VGTLSNNKLASRESVTGLFGKVLEPTAGYRFNTRLVCGKLIIILVMIKQWHNNKNRLISYDPATSPAATYVSFTAKGQIIAFDLAPLWFCF
jgi:hypothetical protein